MLSNTQLRSQARVRIGILDARTNTGRRSSVGHRQQTHKIIRSEKPDVWDLRKKLRKQVDMGFVDENLRAPGDSLEPSAANSKIKDVKITFYTPDESIQLPAYKNPTDDPVFNETMQVDANQVHMYQITITSHNSASTLAQFSVFDLTLFRLQPSECSACSVTREIDVHWPYFHRAICRYDIINCPSGCGRRLDTFVGKRMATLQQR